MTDWTLYLVTDPDLAGGPDNVPHIVSQAISGGVSVVQLRDKRATRGEIRQHAQALCEVTGNIPLFINDYVDIAAELGLHAHIGQSDTRYVEARKLLPDHLMLGLSIETHEQLITVIADAQEAGVRLPDVIGIGPVRATSTKPDHAAPLGVEGVAAIARTAVCYGIATVAIGGVDKQCRCKKRPRAGGVVLVLNRVVDVDGLEWGVDCVLGKCCRGCVAVSTGGVGKFGVVAVAFVQRASYCRRM